jgi:hypothetical protein
MEIEGHHESITRRHPPGLHPPGFKYNEEINKCGGNEVNDSHGKGNVMFFCFFFQVVVCMYTCWRVF